MIDARWHTLLDQAKAAHTAIPALGRFCTFPQTLSETPIAPRPDPLTEALGHDTGLDNTGLNDTEFAAFRDAVIAAAPLAPWRDTYRGTPTGDALHQHFGTFEILGHDAPFRTDEMRGFVIYQTRGYHYPMHHHPAEELYLVLAGEAEFHAEGTAPRILRPGDTAFHASNQPHGLTTQASPIMAYVLWRGDLDTRPVFTAQGPRT